MSVSTMSASEVHGHVSDKFNFTVDKFPLYGPEGMNTNGLYGLFRSDNGEHVGRACSKRYVPHQTQDVLTLVEAASEAFDEQISVDCHFRSGHYVAIAPTAEKRRSVYGNADNVWPRIMIRAGYDGQSFQASMGYWRDLCNNLAMIRQVEGTTVAIRHTSGLRYKMDSLISSFSTLKESWGNLHSVIMHMQNKEVSAVDFLNAVYGTPKDDEPRKKTIHEDRTKVIFNKLYDERFRSGRPPAGAEHKYSVWEMFNAVQGFHQHKRTAAQQAGTVPIPTFMADVVRASRSTPVHRAEQIALELVG